MYCVMRASVPSLYNVYRHYDTHSLFMTRLHALYTCTCTYLKCTFRHVHTEFKSRKVILKVRERSAVGCEGRIGLEHISIQINTCSLVGEGGGGEGRGG